VIYETETWATNAEQRSRLERTEMSGCGVLLRDKKMSDELRNMLGMECLEVLRRGRSWDRSWFEKWVRRAMDINVEGSRSRLKTREKLD